MSSEYEKDDLAETIIMGLTTDGAHHKQYYLEEAMRQIYTNEYVDKAKAHFQWEDGQP